VIETLEVLVLGFAAGVVAGLFGVGGGIVFVPTLAILLGLGQLEAQATSLLAIIPAAAVGAWQQGRYGNLRLCDGIVLGLLAAGGTFVGVAASNAVPERVLEVGFACIALFTAFHLARRALTGTIEGEESGWRR
jgi:uncharacterized membrane protein YfcA